MESVSTLYPQFSGRSQLLNSPKPVWRSCQHDWLTALDIIAYSSASWSACCHPGLLGLNLPSVTNALLVPIMVQPHGIITLSSVGNRLKILQVGLFYKKIFIALGWYSDSIEKKKKTPLKYIDNDIINTIENMFIWKKVKFLTNNNNLNQEIIFNYINYYIFL